MESKASELAMAVIQNHVFKLINDRIPQAKEYLEMFDDDDPCVGYIGDGFMDGRDVKDLNLPKELEDEILVVYDFEKWTDPNFTPDPSCPEVDKNECLKFKIKVK